MAPGHGMQGQKEKGSVRGLVKQGAWVLKKPSLAVKTKAACFQGMGKLRTGMDREVEGGWVRQQTPTDTPEKDDFAHRLQAGQGPPVAHVHAMCQKT